ncbi:MAG: tetratricopeptide repeat protein [Vicinamibacterales bacterium]
MISTDRLLARLGDAAATVAPPETARLALVVRPAPAAHRAAAAVVAAFRERHPSAQVVDLAPAWSWPFRGPGWPALPDGPVLAWAPDVHDAFVNLQTNGTRLVTTQPVFLAQSWLDATAGRDDVLLLCTADPARLAGTAPEILDGRGPFGSAWIDQEPATAPPPPDPPGDGSLEAASPEALLARAMRDTSAEHRLELGLAALAHGRTAAVLVAMASIAMEVNDLDAARRDLEEALALAPDWAATHFEYGKLWLRLDDMDRAGDAFQAAADRMPAFSPAWANLGATLGERDRTAEALAAFEHALAHDPRNHQTLNNIGVVRRELGRLAESEAAFRSVVERCPDQAFGYYNLGHTLFLQGRYQAALTAYADGQRRDPARNPVQASRLALCRLATGDGAGALRELQQAVSPLPPGDYRRQLLAETHAVLWALVGQRPDLAGWGPMNEWLTAQLARA